MALVTGDIIIRHNFWGHVLMAYSPTELVHASNDRGFFKESVSYENAEGETREKLENGDIRYRPPWDKCSNPQRRQADLQAIADEIIKSATYGTYRMTRLKIGSSIFGPDASNRLMKYIERKNNFYKDKSGKSKFVTTITCVEAVVLCYQLAFSDVGDPFFIRLDGAHSMPSTLEGWLAKNWGKGNQA